MDFSNIETIVPVLRQPVAFPPSTPGDPPLIVQVRGRKWRHETRAPASYLVAISQYLSTYYHLPFPQLRWCSACAEHHSQRTVCLSESLLPDESRVVMLVSLLDGSLCFSWEEMEHFKVLELCDFFRLKQSYVLPMFKASLRYKYALFHESIAFYIIFFVYVCLILML